MASQIIDKLEAACRQINTAIALWFNDDDAISIHTLASSAYQIVHDINRHQGGRDLLYDSILIKDEFRGEAITNYLKKHYNFFKHANKDPSGTIEFDPIITEGLIIFTTVGLELLGRGPDEVRGAFNIYYCLRNPHLLNDRGKRDFIDSIEEEIRNNVLNLPKQKFFEYYTMLRKRHLSGSLRPHFM